MTIGHIRAAVQQGNPVHRPSGTENFMQPGMIQYDGIPPMMTLGLDDSVAGMNPAHRFMQKGLPRDTERSVCLPLRISSSLIGRHLSVRTLNTITKLLVGVESRRPLGSETLSCGDFDDTRGCLHSSR